MAAEGKVPVLDSVGGAFRAVRPNWTFILVAGAVSAVALTALSAVQVAAPLLSLPASVIALLITAYLYAALTGAMLDGASNALKDIGAHGGRMFASMAIVGFFMGIVFIAVSIAGMIVIFFSAAEYFPELEAAGQDQAAMMEVMGRIVMGKPVTIGGVILVSCAIWMLLTSRLFLAAPATYAEKRILSFETWKWTKGNMLRITAARLVLLGPAYVLVFAISMLAWSAVGINIFNPVELQTFMTEQLVLFLLIQFGTSLVQVPLYTALEAALSAYLYKGLGPREQQVQAF